MNSSGGRSGAGERQRLPKVHAEQLKSTKRIDSLDWTAFQELIHATDALKYAPDGVVGIDPRNGEATLFNHRRARRPHDYRSGSEDGAKRTAPEPDPIPGAAETAPLRIKEPASCPICAGTTTPVLDIVDLSDGFSFINLNLYPILFPDPVHHAIGVHLLHWTSSYHDVDWPELSSADRRIAIRQLANLERSLLNLPGFPSEERYVSLIKNVGRAVGGSLTHGHQQIALGNVRPRRVRENRNFAAERGKPFSRHIREVNPEHLTVSSVNGTKLVVPTFMRRPFDMLLVPEDTESVHLHELAESHLADLVDCFADAMERVRLVLNALGREVAFNAVFHTGEPGIYVEILPLTQEEGGFEKLGMSVCQSTPETAAQALREVRRPNRA